MRALTWGFPVLALTALVAMALSSQPRPVGTKADAVAGRARPPLSQPALSAPGSSRGEVATLRAGSSLQVQFGICDPKTGPTWSDSRRPDTEVTMHAGEPVAFYFLVRGAPRDPKPLFLRAAVRPLEGLSYRADPQRAMSATRREQLKRQLHALAAPGYEMGEMQRSSLPLSVRRLTIGGEAPPGRQASGPAPLPLQIREQVEGGCDLHYTGYFRTPEGEAPVGTVTVHVVGRGRRERPLESLQGLGNGNRRGSGRVPSPTHRARLLTASRRPEG